MKKLSVLSFCLHTNGYLFRRILPIIILTFSTLMRVSDEKAFSTFIMLSHNLFRRNLPIVILTFSALMRVSDEKAFSTFILLAHDWVLIS